MILLLSSIPFQVTDQYLIFILFFYFGRGIAKYWQTSLFDLLTLGILRLDYDLIWCILISFCCFDIVRNDTKVLLIWRIWRQGFQVTHFNFNFLLLLFFFAFLFKLVFMFFFLHLCQYIAIYKFLLKGISPHLFIHQIS